MNLYRIVQEQLRNIQKHAPAATTIAVSLRLQNDLLQMQIEDNGATFNPVMIKDGIGFSNMKRRVELFSGSMEIHRTPGNGCLLKFKIPVKQESKIEGKLILQNAV